MYALLSLHVSLHHSESSLTELGTLLGGSEYVSIMLVNPHHCAGIQGRRKVACKFRSY